MRKKIGSLMALLLVVGTFQVLASTAAQATAPVGVSDKLQGCKPGTYNPVTVLCADTDYVNGNLGKSWNELDLVPFRLTLDAGNGGNVPATQTYTLAYAVDAIDGGKPGYDVLSAAVKNTSLSTGGAGNCAFSVSPTAAADPDGATFSPGIGGTDTTRYRFITVTQAKNTKCVFDLFARLALGSSGYPGSSLHANMLNENLGTSGVGADDTSIPVKEILPQTIQKNMTGTQDSDHQWTLNKAASPATLNFGNVCDPNQDVELETEVTITWDKLPANPSGVINIHTLVEATNPAARIITVKVTDELRSGTTVLQTHDNGANGVDVPANSTNFDVLEYTTTLPAGTQNINDVATATYIDKVTQVQVPGNTTAVFPPAGQSFVIGQGQVTNATAVITDTESITGAGLTFKVATPSVGTFTGGYVAGTPTTGPVGWDSGTQSDDGSVTFAKTVILDGSVGATSGTLDDTADLLGSNGATAQASASVNIDSTLAGSLVINKTTTVPVDGDTTFEFTVTPGGTVVPVTILDGQTSGSSDPLTGLTAGNYSVEETNSQGFTPAADQQFTIGAGNCNAELNFENTFGPATAQVFKITVPAGTDPSGFSFDITGPNGFADTGTSNALGTVDWAGAGSDTLTLADEGNYVVTELTQSGFTLTAIDVNDNGNGSGAVDLNTRTCSFTVDYPADADGVFSCTYTNERDTGNIIVQKVTDPDPDTTDTSFGFTSDYGAPFSLKNGEFNDSGPLPTGTYSVAEDAAPLGWDHGTFTCDDGSLPNAIDLSKGETVTCTATNIQRGTIIIEKVVTGPNPDDTSFEFTKDFGVTPVNLKDGESITTGNLLAGTYSASENTPAGWDLVSENCSDGSDPQAIDLNPGETVTCTFTNTQQTGTITVVKVTDPSPSDTEFPFLSNFMGNFPLKDAQSKTSDPLTVNGGPYSVEELTPLGWDLTSFTCDNGDDPTAINVTANGNVTCTAVNVQRGSIKVVKVTDPAGVPQKFDFTGDLNGSIGDGEFIESLNLVPGEYSTTEDVPVGWDLTSIVCDDNNSTGDTATGVATFKLEPGENITCTYTNTRQTGRIIIAKVTDPSPDPTDPDTAFEFTASYKPNFTLTDGTNDGGTTLPTGTYSVTEINVPQGWSLKSFTCDDNSDPANIDLGASEVVTCTATNELLPGTISVEKTVNGQPDPNESFTIELRQGAADTDPGTGNDTPGTLLDSQTVVADGNPVQLDGDLAPGTYQVCETDVAPGADVLFDGQPADFVLTLNLVNDRLCVNVEVAADTDVTVQVDNIPPPGGGQRTIGYWKNHASCKLSQGNQEPVLDQTLATFPIASGQTLPGFYVGDLYVDTCVEARQLLDKRPVSGNNKKTANDPAFNLAAQFVAAKLNVQAGAATCPAANTAINDAQALLDSVNFLGVVPPTMTAAQKAQANSLATTLDQYNNGLLC